MKPPLSQRIHRILAHNVAARTSKKIAFQIFQRESADEPEILKEVNPDSFARTWRRHSKSF
jgi:hypothetical protein